jgi:hypothetical protein
MSKRAPAHWIAVALACLACAPACKGGLGRALVDMYPAPAPGGMPGECAVPPRCDDETSGAPEAGVEPIEITPVALKTCGAFVPAACGDDALGPMPNESGDAADAGAGAECSTTLALGARDTVPNAIALDCTAQRFDAVADADAPDLVKLRRAVWRHSNVAITGMRPITLELEAATLEDVWIELSGPITLRVTEDSTLTNVRMRTRDDRAGAPRIDLRDSHAQNLAVAPEEDDAFASLTLARMHLDHADLRARDVTMESVAGGGMRIDAVELTSADGWFNSVDFVFDRALIASLTANKVNVSRCGKLTIVNGTFERATLTPCTDGPMRVYGATINYSLIDGDVDGDHALFEFDRFGVHEDLEITGWDTTFTAVNFCRHTKAVRFGNLPAVTCSECADDKSDVDPHACQAPATMVTSRKNFCEVLNERPMPLCPAPEPERERPH